MTVHAPLRNPGGASVGDLLALDRPQTLAVLLLRDWFEGQAGMLRVHDLFTETLGEGAGQRAADAWADFAGFLVTHARRPIMRHAPACRCVGADEATFAQLLHLAATGEREDAMLILTLLVPADRAFVATYLAEDVGLAVMRAARAAATPSNTLH